MEKRNVQVPPQREGNNMCTPTRAASSVYSKTPLFAHARALLHPRPTTHLVTLLSTELLAQLSRLSFVVALLFTEFFSHTQGSSCLLPCGPVPAPASLIVCNLSNLNTIRTSRGVFRSTPSTTSSRRASYAFRTCSKNPFISLARSLPALNADLGGASVVSVRLLNSNLNSDV